MIKTRGLELAFRRKQKRPCELFTWFYFTLFYSLTMNSTQRLSKCQWDKQQECAMDFHHIIALGIYGMRMQLIYFILLLSPDNVLNWPMQIENRGS